MKTVFTSLLILFTSLSVWAQNVQTIRGQVTDAQSNYPLVGAVIVVVNSNPLQGTTTDENGNFRLEKVAQGRQAIKISMLGYEERIIPNVLLTAGKELTLNIGLQERLVSSADVVITAKESNRELINNEFVPTMSLIRLGIYQYNARIHELRKIGHCIESIHNKELGLWGYYLKVD
jgi:hypothetical protein